MVSIANLHRRLACIGMVLAALLVMDALPNPVMAQTIEWIRQFGTGNSDIAWGVAADVTGIYIVGTTFGTLPGQTSAGRNDVLVRKYNANGNVLWTRQFGSPGGDTAVSVAVDSTGVYVVGNTDDALPGQSSAGGFADAFARKYDLVGNELWTRQFGTDGSDRAEAVAVDETGVYVVGSTEGTLPGQTKVGFLVDAFVRKYDAGGNELWTRQFGSSGTAAVQGIAVDAAGVYIAGQSNTPLPGQTSAGGIDAFVRKYDADGNEQWTHQFGTAGDDVAWDAEVDAAGLYVAGLTGGNLPGQVSTGAGDAFVRKYDADGNEQWTHQFGTVLSDIAWEVEADSTGVYVAGEVRGALPGQSAAGGRDAFVRKYDASGNEVWTRQFGTASTDAAFGVAGDFTNIYVVGSTNGMLGGQTRLGSDDAFVVGVRPPLQSYYLPHLALGAGWQTTLTFLNYSASPVTCQTTFLNDAGAPLAVPFGGPANSVRTDVLAALGSLHIESTADLNAPVQAGWARVSCNGAIKPSILFRFYSQGVPTGEASVNTSKVPATKFVTFAEQLTGVAYANPSSQTASITVTAFNTAGQTIGTANVVLPPDAHSAANLNSLLGITNFVGSAQIVSTVPIVALSLNFEAFPVFSSLPPGDFDDTIAPSAQTYYLPHLALGSGWQTTLTYLNYSASQVTCTTTFLSDAGAPLAVPFGGPAASSRMDVLPARGSIHRESTADLSAPVQAGWARVQCNAPVKPSILFRFYSQGVPTGEASVNASQNPATRFVTFAEQLTGVAYANSSAQTASITVTAFNTAGQTIGGANVTLPPGAHGAANLNALLGITNFVGSAQFVSTVPIVSLSLNFEAFPVFSSLPPGDLPD